MFNATNSRFARLVLLVPLITALPAAGQTVTEDIKLTASDAAADDAFGGSVSLSGTTAIIGASGDDDSTGAAYVFNTATGQQLFKLTASDAVADDRFGWSVAVSGTTAIVGAPFHNGGAGNSSGAAYIFDTTTGQQLGKLTASDAATSDSFGWSVAISGTTAIVGSLSDAAYVFSTSTGLQLGKLTASDASSARDFGWSVSISGPTAIIGAPGWALSPIQIQFGAAYIFDMTTGQERFRIMASDPLENSAFGFSVAISGDTAIVGAIDGDGIAIVGSAYVFDTTSGEQQLKLSAPNAVLGDAFGESVAIFGDTAIVGARRDNNQGQTSGSVYAFDTTTGERLLKHTPSDGATLDEFGISMAISGSTIIVGALGSDGTGSNSGSAYIFSRPPEITSQPQSVIVSPGETAVLSVGVNNPGTREFRWRRDGVELSNGGNITGARSPTLQLIAGSTDEAVYDCVISNPVSIVTNAVVIAVRSDPNVCTADLNSDGLLNFFDVSVFLSAFGAGCP